MNIPFEAATRRFRSDPGPPQDRIDGLGVGDVVYVEKRADSPLAGCTPFVLRVTKTEAYVELVMPGAPGRYRAWLRRDDLSCIGRMPFGEV